MTLGGAAQLAAAHCPNEPPWTPQSTAITVVLSGVSVFLQHRNTEWHPVSHAAES